MTEPMRCGSCGKVVLNHPEPYLGEPAALAVAPTRAVAAQRSALISCTVCRETAQAQSRAFAYYARREMERTGAKYFSICYGGRETFGDHSDEWEDVETGRCGHL